MAMKSTGQGQIATLSQLLQELPSCLIAFSGGLDSGFLAVMAKKCVPGRALAVTVVDCSTPKADFESARKLARQYSLEHRIIYATLSPSVRQNPRNRCYYCKRQLFGRLKKIKEEERLEVILDGENASDCEDHRPGLQAARECEVFSPLAQAGLNKEKIRLLARDLGLEIWNRPPSACLSSRIPFGTAIKDIVLRQVDLTEEIIRKHGIMLVRARAEAPDSVRIELGKEENHQTNWELLTKLEQEIRALGWKSIRIDQSGYMPAGLRQSSSQIAEISSVSTKRLFK